MAVRTAVVSFPSNYQGRSAVYAWSGLLNGDTGTTLDPTVFDGAALQVTGTFGVGGSLTLEGTVDGTNYVALNTLAAAAIAVTAAGLVQIQSPGAYLNIRPRVTAGDGTTNLAATLLLRATNRY